MGVAPDFPEATLQVASCHRGIGPQGAADSLPGLLQPRLCSTHVHQQGAEGPGGGV